MQLRRLLRDELAYYSNGQLKEKEEEEKAELQDDEKEKFDENLLKKLDEFGLASMVP